MRTAEKKLIERNLDLLFEFEKYVLEHPKITEKIPRNAVVFMKVAGDEKFNLWSERQAKKQAKKGAPLISVTVKNQDFCCLLSGGCSDRSRARLAGPSTRQGAR